ncbi:hypothetical protein AVEN_236552-1 [Araneus ventricosus]|uniref:HAT C-terminal dimerisation domain-containing protein n=1 Tax=Araneus ventricosus TaxID=182803 RepID=A0A4Y2LL93_ARAVE|nr:hypothetical protein AVEN_236552-1 [Araneus ventricosus]
MILKLDEDPPKKIQAKLLFCFYFFILDVTIKTLQERFEELNAVQKMVLSNIKDAKLDKSLGMFKDFHLTLSDSNHNDVHGFQLTLPRNISHVNSTTRPSDQLLKILTYFNMNRVATNFPNLSVDLNVSLTILVTEAAGERSFSKLKLIETYCRVLAQ